MKTKLFMYDNNLKVKIIYLFYFRSMGELKSNKAFIFILK